MASLTIFKKGDVIFKEGDWQMWMYELKSGKVAIYSAYGTDREKMLTELGEGRIFGEMGLIESRVRSATAVAAEDTELELIDSDGFAGYFSKNPEKVLDILRNLSNRLRELSGQYIEACTTLTEYVAEAEASSPKKESLWKKLLHFMEQGDLYGSVFYDPFGNNVTFI